MDSPSPPKPSWSERLARWLSAWARPTRRDAPPIQVLQLSPPCSECGAHAATVELAEYADGWRLYFVGAADLGNSGRDRISADEARTIREALSPPYEPTRIQAAGFYDDFGFCIACQAFYCGAHWQVSATGGGTCPAGHFKSLDPHWRPDWDDL